MPMPAHLLCQYQRCQRPQLRTLLAGALLGGVLLAFADFVMYRAIGDVVGHQIKFATINLNSQFLAAVKAGELLCGHGRIVRQSRCVIFADCELYTSQRTVMTASGIWKVLGQ
mgnify:CR=1 FL=1